MVAVLATVLSLPETVGSATGGSRITNILPDERTNSLIIIATERAYLRILELIAETVKDTSPEGSTLVEMCSYHMETGGKRLRAVLPLLVAASGF